MTLIDLTGRKISHLTVLRRSEDALRWLCRCDCGRQLPILGHRLRDGSAKSCGCLNAANGFIDLANRQFGRLTVVRQVDNYHYGNGKQRARWMCRCDCGKECTVTSTNLVGGTQSCGCLQRERTSLSRATHRRSKSAEYQIWRSAKERCFNPRNQQYANYGGRGIVMCEEWRHSFESFLAHIGPRPPGLTLERIDNSRGYEPGNVCWETRKQQCRNTRRNVIVTVRGKTASVIELAEHFGVNYNRVRHRIIKGWQPERAFFAPVYAPIHAPELK